MTNVRVYRFSHFQLDPAARELRREGELLPVPRRVFDALAHLIQQRDRAVSHDELITTLWGRTQVANAQVSQLIMQVRRAVGDDSNAQQIVRTVSGFGYRWIAATEEHDADDARADGKADPAAAAPLLAADALIDAVDPRSDSTGGPATRRYGIGLVVLAGLLLLLALLLFGRRPDQGSSSPRQRAAQAIVVLPLDLEAPEKNDTAWVRLGVMDLIANRLHDAGLPIAPSDAVIAALHATAALPEAQRSDKLKHLLGADTLVRGTASRSASGWSIALTEVAAGDAGRRVESSQREVMDSARQAADLLLAALGHAPPIDADTETGLGDYVQRARAATLAGELDTARLILTSVPGLLRDDPALRCELARVEFHAGQLDEAKALTDALLDDPAVLAQPRLHTSALRIRGWVETAGEDEDWAAAERYFDASVGAMGELTASGTRGKILAERGLARVFLHRFDDAVLDLGQATSLLEIAGDRQGLGEMKNYLGQLEFMRGRVAESAQYFSAAAEIGESFGSIDALRYNLTALLRAQMRLLRWPDALATSERLSTLRERIENPGLRASMDGYRASVLVALGRLREAEAVLAGTSGVGVSPSMVRFVEQARAELAWQQGHPEQVLAAANKALAAWPQGSPVDSDRHAYLALLHQRASLAIGQPMAASIVGEAGMEDSVAIYRLVADAEWANHQDQQENAARLFRDAAAKAEALGVADTIALVAQARGYWLIAHGDIAQASAVAGRIAVWSGDDFESALLQVAVFHAAAHTDAWRRALPQAVSLAGERAIPESLRTAPPALRD